MLMAEADLVNEIDVFAPHKNLDHWMDHGKPEHVMDLETDPGAAAGRIPRV